MALTTDTTQSTESAARTAGTTGIAPRALHPREINWAALRAVYPESDGQPMADNTLQFQWIDTIVGGLQALFRDAPDVFVAGDLLWYPVEGRPEVCLAPDALVVFGRPKGHRGSYAQFLEGGIPPQVVFEVLSQVNTRPRLARKRAFYEQHGVEEYYEYDPDRGQLRGWLRQEARLVPIPEMRGWVSPRLGVRFDLDGQDLALYRPDGERFRSYVELDAERAHARDQEAAAERRAAAANQRAEQAQLRAERLAAQLRALGIAPDAG